MAKQLLSAMYLSLLVGLPSACTNPPPAPTPVVAPATSVQASPSPGSQTANVPISLDEQNLKAQFNLDTSKLTYNFNFLNITQSNVKITFVNGATTLQVPGLPSNQAGDLTLDVLESGVLKLHGSAPGITLQPGTMKIKLVMQAVGSTDPGGSTELNINVAFADGTPSPTSTPSPVVTPSPSVLPTATPSASGTQGNAPSFARDITPIMVRACAECHHTGGLRPDLSQAASMASAVEAVLNTAGGAPVTMPPKPRDALSRADIDKIRAWRDGGQNP